MAGISQSKQLWHCTAMRKGPAWPCARRATSRPASATSGRTARANAEKPLANGRKAQRPDILFHQSRAVVAFQRFELVRQRRLGQKQARGRLRQAPAFGEGEQRLQVP